MITKVITIVDHRAASRVPIIPAHTPAPGGTLADTRGRLLRDLRISVTGRCNFRCTYCMPKSVCDKAYHFLPKSELLSFEEITRMNATTHSLSRRETILAGIALAVLALPFALPHVAQSPAYHHFADTRTLFGVANAMDTLSNFAFIIAGVAGIVLVWLRRLPEPTTALGAMSLLTFIGLVATGIGSAWYHGQVPPNDAGLAIDRYGMVVSFAGVLGLAAAHKVSERAGWWTGWLVLVAGPFAVWWWTVSGNVAPYAVLQFGGMALLVLILFWRDEATGAAPSGAASAATGGTTAATPSAGPNWGLLIGAYALAKVFEAGDAQIWELTARLISGHTLKHLAAALVAVAVIAPLYRRHA